MGNNKKCDIIIAGVGGQGVLLCSDILGEACIIEGIPVKGAEVHGMSQRGGSVEAHVRIGGIHGPRIPVGRADILIAMEPLEGARFSYYLNDGAFAVVNTAAVPFLGQSYQVNEILDIIRNKTSNLITGDFSKAAIETGSLKTLNIFMLGIASGKTPLQKESFLAAIKKSVKEKFVEMNLEAFKSGTDMGK
ncbi:MAG TPA: indolepyruvate oxidoreductase subunit beta [bacterium]|nr:indolepyruvate oxidoreductase subunit beta [bacterium]